MLRISKLRTLMNYKIPAATIGAEVLSGAIGAALGLALAVTSAAAQDSPGDSWNGVSVSPTVGRSYTGAPVVIVSQSRAVRSDDLDLRTEEGAREFQDRVKAAARSICRDLSFMYPASYEGWGTRWSGDHDCYRGAMTRATPQIAAAVDAARGEYGGH
jgi:UrcA family protein